MYKRQVDRLCQNFGGRRLARSARSRKQIRMRDLTGRKLVFKRFGNMLLPLSLIHIYIIRAGDKADPEEVEKAFNWLTENVGNIAYDGKGLTPEKLRTQIRSYIGLRDICLLYTS